MKIKTMNELIKDIHFDELAKLLNVTKQTIYNYRNSSWMKLDVEQVFKIAKKIKVKPKDLVMIIIREHKRKNKKR